MKRRGLWFAGLALASALLSLWIALLPIRILRGKIPDAPADLVMQVALTEGLPALAPGALLLLFAWWRFAKHGEFWQWGLLLAAGPLASLVFLVAL
jgi:hypothetical protein